MAACWSSRGRYATTWRTQGWRCVQVLSQSSGRLFHYSLWHKRSNDGTNRTAIRQKVRTVARQHPWQLRGRRHHFGEILNTFEHHSVQIMPPSKLQFSDEILTLALHTFKVISDNWQHIQLGGERLRSWIALIGFGIPHLFSLNNCNDQDFWLDLSLQL